MTWDGSYDARRSGGGEAGRVRPVGDTVDGGNPKQPTWDEKNLVNNGINYQPQLVQDFFHQQ